MSKPTLVQQWQAARDKHPDAVIFIRVGDFYELLGPDAEIGVRELGLALTGKGNGAGQLPMAGVPAKSRDEYAERLLQAGHRVALCEQVEDPREAQGTVRREVVEVLTPGAVLSDSLLSAGRNNFLAALAGTPERAALAAVDVTTGELMVVAVGEETLETELSRLEPAELLLPAGWDGLPFPGAERLRVTRRPDILFDAAIGADEVAFHYGVDSLEGFGIRAGDEAVVSALGGLLAYLREVQPASLAHLRPPRVERSGDGMVLDAMTVRNLELLEPLRREPGMKPREGTLLGVIDETLTPMGARLLRGWLTRPLLTPERIEARLEAVSEFAGDGELRRRIRAGLASVRDLERLAGRLATGRIAPREMRALADSLGSLPALRDGLSAASTPSLQKVFRTLDPLPDVHGEIDRALLPAPGAAVGEDGVIREGYDSTLDELRGLRAGAADWMARFQVQERQRTGISHLKVGFHRTFGYYLEVPNAVAARAPEHYERRQTLANAERYTTPELKEWESRILEADERIAERERSLYDELRERVATHVRRVQDAALRVAMIDVLAGLAECAVRRAYNRPEIDTGYALRIDGGRHPVVETMMPTDRYIPNDVRLDEDSRVIILTGPNMGGKSTLLRQVGLIQLMAQIGSFVPADRARLGICDRIYTRVGASDNLVRGQSTFMVEASECATILNGATRRSLVLMDEVGRGTSTWDGVSLAWAITEELEAVVGAKTIFATHYHELTQLAELLPGVVNFNVAAREDGDRIVFLHRLVAGGADRSYGIEVARLAGVPATVIRRAREILRTLEGSRAAESRVIEHLAEPAPATPPLESGSGAEREVAGRILALDISRTAPLDALNLLDELQRKLRG